MQKDLETVADRPSELYLDLMKKSLLASIYEENQWYVLGSLDNRADTLKQQIKKIILSAAWHRKFLIVKAAKGVNGGWGLLNYTMIGKKRLDNIQVCIEDVIRNEVPGDLIETGAWRGGATIFMRAVLKVYGITDRKVWVADSFEGLPSLKGRSGVDDLDAATDVDSVNDGGPLMKGLAVTLEKVRDNFERFGLLDDQVVFLKGWFEDTLPSAPIEKLAILRLDGDMYASTMDALNALYHKVSSGGYIIVDDYNCWPHCKRAVDEFRSRHGITAEIFEIDTDGIYWKV